MITEDYVSFEVAKLLNEKDFDELCYACYEYFESCVTLYRGWTFEYKGNPVHNSLDRIKCPTLQMAMKWLREVHRIETHIALSELNADNSRKYMFDIFSSDMNRDFDSIQEYGFNSYEKTCEAAIKYCLENLI